MKPRKTRKAETRRYEVRWLAYDTIYMRWYKRVDAAKRLAAELKAEGYEVLVAEW